MRTRRVLALVCLAILVAALALPGTAAAKAGDFPYGRYQGSAVGNNEGSKPIAVTVWLADGGGGMVKISVSTPAVPFAFDANPAMPTSVTGGFDLPIGVNVGSGENAINGSGTLQIRSRGDSWEMWGSGSGSALGKSGGGRGSASRTSQDAGLVDQFMGPLRDTFGSFTSDTEVAQPTEYPADEFAQTPPDTEPAEASTSSGNWFTDLVGNDVPPNEIAELLVLTVMLLFMVMLGVTVW